MLNRSPGERTAPVPTGRLLSDPSAGEAPADVWTILGDPATGTAQYCKAWLAMQCGLIPGARSGLLVLIGPGGAPAPAALWQGAARTAELTRMAARAIADRRTVIAWGRPDGAGAAPDAITLTVAQPFGPAETPYGAVAIAVSPEGGIDRADPEGVARQLRGGSGWLELLGQREGSRSALAEHAETRLALQQAASAMDALAVIGEHPRLVPSAMAVANELATRLRCQRVSIGLVRNGAIRLQAMSHAAGFQRSSGIVDAIEDAMEEALAQGAPVGFPPPPAGPDSTGLDMVCISHHALAKASGAASAVLSVLLPGASGQATGVLTLERHRGEPFDGRTVTLASAIAALAGPVIGLQVRGHRWVAGRAVDMASHGIGLVLGPRRPALKLAALAAGVALTWMALATGVHRVGARAVVEGEVQRAAVAPFDGFVVQAPARAGDTVRAGDLLAALDDRELQLESVKAWAERDKLRQRHQEAMSKHERAGAAVLAAQIDQAQAVLSLAQDKLARTRIVAPVDGIVVSGDLSQMLGSPVERGKVLFEVAPMDRFRLAIQVDEVNVRWVKPGQTGTLRLASMPGQPVAFTVTGRMPVANAEDGRNVFRVEAALDSGAVSLRPGMEGNAKVDVGERNLLWVWLHPVYETVMLALWKWAP